jgi:hypothetical protein
LAFTKIDQSLKAATFPEKDKTTLDLWLDSPGGSARDAYKIALLLRSIACRIRVVIPDFAKSAGTLLSLVADEIYMGPAAELGPLDVQLDYEKNPGMRVSALDRIGNLNEITEAARDIVLGLGGANSPSYTENGSMIPPSPPAAPKSPPPSPSPAPPSGASPTDWSPAKSAATATADRSRSAAATWACRSVLTFSWRSQASWKAAERRRFHASGGQGLRPCTHFRFWAALVF